MNLTAPKFNLNCPLPKLDFEQITLGHGSGGLLTRELLEKMIFNVLGNNLLNRKHDGAQLKLEGPVAFTTDSFVITPIFFPGGNIGELAVNGTVNDLAMCGAKPQYLSLSFILEEGLPVKELWEIIRSIKSACEAAGVQVVTGDTKVVERGKGDKIFINTTGIGTVHPKAAIDAKNIRQGDKIILSGQLANHGISIFSVREGLEFESEIQSDTRPLHNMVLGLLDNLGTAIHLLRDPTRGGLATVLSEIARDGGVGIEVLQQKLPIDEQVESACEMLGLDPLYIANEGIFAAVVDAGVADEVFQCLQGFEGGKHAAVIGEVTAEHPGKVVMTSAIGGKRAVGLLAGEPLPRIC